ncbi:MAG TPA: hypothetical protein PLO61_02405 [Fimbriimonadaceae bacterium]|nr:hypothetical protein [Fimbriimonadaceae bacterium]HRJ31960.1 hypothetical protein [Fimbriimonadaceae bacterium]
MDVRIWGRARTLTLLLSFLGVMLAGLAHAGTLTVTAPNNGSFLGRTNAIRFQLKQARVQAKVTAVASLNSNPSQKITVEQNFTPNADGEVDGQLTLNFNEGTPEGEYTITVSVNEPNNSYNTETRNVTVDTTRPVFIEVSPLTGSFVGGTVLIRARINEPNIKEWRVTVNNNNIPNNSGSTSNLEVRWDTSGIKNDGPQTITISVKDEADNETSRTVNVTLDRVRPSATILTPNGITPIRQQSNIPVAIDVSDQFERSIDVTGIEVILQTLDGRFIQRVSRVSSRNNGNATQWSGRIRWNKSLPTVFRMIVNITDKAGNVAIQQSVVVRYGS